MIYSSAFCFSRSGNGKNVLRGTLKKCFLLFACVFFGLNFLNAQCEEDHPNLPQGLETYQVGQTYPFSISSNSDVDWFKFVPASQGVYRIVITGVPLTPNNFNVQITAHVADEFGNATSIATTTLANNTGGQLVVLFCTPNEPMLVKVNDGSNNASSSTCMNIQVVLDSPECECNNTFGTACFIPSVDTTFQNRLYGQNNVLSFIPNTSYLSFQTGLDQDYFKIIPNGAGVLSVSITAAPPNAQVPSNLRLILNVYNSNQQLLNTATASSNGSNVSLQTLLCGQDTCYIRIHEYYQGGVYSNPYENSPTPFQVSFSYDISDGCECNNTFDTACLITPIDTAFQAKLNGQNNLFSFIPNSNYNSFQTSLDQDYFKIEPEGSGVLRVGITAAPPNAQVPSNLRLIISVYNSNQILLNTATASSNGSDVSLRTLLCGGGIYYIRIHEYYSGVLGVNNSPYENSSTPFQVTFSYDTSDSCECNNTFETACEIMVTDTFDFKINGVNQLMYYTPNDRDFFKFCPDNCGNVNFKVIGIPQGFQLRARVYTDTTAINTPLQNVTATGLNNLNLTFPVVSGQCYYVMLSHNNDTQISAQAMTAQVSFTPSITPPVISASGSTDLCPGQCVTLTTNATVDHHWSTGATTQSIQVCEAGIYRDTIQDALGCFGVSEPITITVQQGTNAQFTATPNGANVQFTNQSTGSTTYLWEFGDGSSSDEVSPSHTYTQSGTYTVTLTADGPCGQDVYTFEVTVNFVGIEESENVSFNVFPNPSNGLFTIETKERGITNYTVYNATGKPVLNGMNASQRFTLDISHLPDGTYLLKVNDETRLLNKVR